MGQLFNGADLRHRPILPLLLARLADGAAHLGVRKEGGAHSAGQAGGGEPRPGAWELADEEGHVGLEGEGERDGGPHEGRAAGDEEAREIASHRCWGGVGGEGEGGKEGKDEEAKARAIIVGNQLNVQSSSATGDVLDCP